MEGFEKVTDNDGNTYFYKPFPLLSCLPLVKPEPSRFILGRPTMSEETKNKIDYLPTTTESYEGKITLSAFQVPEKEKVEGLIRDAGQYAIIGVGNVDSAEAYVRGAKKVAKLVSDARLVYTKKLDAIKEAAMATEKNIAAAIAPVEAAIVAEKKRQYEEVQAEKRRQEEENNKRILAEQEEIKRQADIKHSIIKIEESLTKQLFSCQTQSQIDRFYNDLRRTKFLPSVYQEFLPEVDAVRERVLGKVKEARETVSNVEASVLREQELQKELAEKKKLLEQQQAQANLQAARDADLRTQVSEQVNQGPKGISVKKVGEVVDISQVPAKYLLINQALLNKDIQLGITEIPGVNIVDEIKRTGR